MSKLRQKALEAINKNSILLLYPIKNAYQIPSVWTCLWPRSKMNWSWDNNADNRVADLWYLKEELSKSGDVIYAKWLKDRATFISKKCFVSLFRVLNPHDDVLFQTSLTKNLYEILEDSSPQGTKSLKKLADCVGKDFEPEYHRSMKELWRRLLVLGWGEVDDGAFPSLNMVCSKTFFEKEYRQSTKLKLSDAFNSLSSDPNFLNVHKNWLDKCLSSISGSGVITKKL